ncbi:MAG: DNL-type zinc finger protein [Gammaproteobacteria bacterium]|nr:DNL-type zinc finger protein [Gammaproteobacteria bacterium]
MSIRQHVTCKRCDSKASIQFSKHTGTFYARCCGCFSASGQAVTEQAAWVNWSNENATTSVLDKIHQRELGEELGIPFMNASTAA